jgi:hypothetical protein
MIVRCVKAIREPWLQYLTLPLYNVAADTALLLLAILLTPPHTANKVFVSVTIPHSIWMIQVLKRNKDYTYFWNNNILTFNISVI